MNLKFNFISNLILLLYMFSKLSQTIIICCYAQVKGTAQVTGDAQVTGANTEVLDSVPIGSIMQMPFEIVPEEYLECDGKEYKIEEYPDLY